MSEITRKQFEDLLKDLQETHVFSYYHGSFEEVFAKHGLSLKEIEKGRHVDKHRWYENSEIIVQVGDWYMGIYGPTDYFSEGGSWYDLYQDVEFYEVKKVEKTIYDYVPLTD